MRLKAIAEACLWLPGFAPDEDPIVTLGTVGEHKEIRLLTGSDEQPPDASAGIQWRYRP